MSGLDARIRKDAGVRALDNEALTMDSIDVTGFDWQLEASTNPAQLPELTRMEQHTSSTASLLSGGMLSPGRKTMKDYEQQQKSLEQENFQLKLRVYMLEERLQGAAAPGADTATIVDLKVQLATLREELAQKKELLRRASDTLESLEQQYGAELERQRRRAEEERLRLERRAAQLETALERTGLERSPPAERSAAELPYLRAFEPLSSGPGQPDQLSAGPGQPDQLSAGPGQPDQLSAGPGQPDQLSAGPGQPDQLSAGPGQPDQLSAGPGQPDQLAQLEASMAELQAALGHMKLTVEERDRDCELLRRQLQEAATAAGQLPELERRCQQLDGQLCAERQQAEQLRAERELSAAEAEQLRAEKERGAAETEQLQTEREQLRAQKERGAAEAERLSRLVTQLRAERDSAAGELAQLKLTLQQEEREPAAVELRRTCDRLTAGRAADAARLAEMADSLQRATDRLKAAAAAESTLSAALQSVGAQLAERTAELAAARKAQRRSAAHVQALIGEQRKLHHAMKHYLADGGGTESGPPDPDTAAPAAAEETACPAALSGGAAPPLTPHEVQIYLLRTETQRKDRRIRGLVAEMKQMNDLLVKYRWEVKELAEEENERLWTELEENKKLIRELQDEKMELVLEKERQIQRLLAQLKERGVAAPDSGDGAVTAADGASQQSPSEASLQEAHTQVASLRSQLSQATLLLGRRDAELSRLRGLLQQRRLLEQPAELGGAGEMAADPPPPAAGRPDTGQKEAAALRSQLSELRNQLLLRDQRLAAADDQLRETAGLRETLSELRNQLLLRDQRLAAADAQLREIPGLRETLASRERELTLAEGQLNEIAELREQLEACDRQLAANSERRRELSQLRRLLAERDQEKAALLRHLDQLRSRQEGREEARLRRRLAETQAAAELLQRRLEQLADFLQLLLELEQRGELDLSCLTARHLAELQTSLLQSRELSQSLTHSLLLGADASALEQSSLHVPELEPVRDSGAAVPAPAPRELRRSEPAPAAAAEMGRSDSLRVSPLGEAGNELSPPGQQSACLQVSKPEGSQRRASSDAATMAEFREPAPAQPAPAVAEAGTQVNSAPESTERATQTGRTQTTESAAQTAQESVQTAERLTQTAGRPAGTAERAASTAERAAQTVGETDRLTALTAQLAGRDAQLLQQAQLVAELRRQLQPPAAGGGGGDERAVASLPGTVRDRFRSLVRRQRTSELASGAETAVERALSPLLDRARARSAELRQLEAGLSGSAGQLPAAVTPAADAATPPAADYSAAPPEAAEDRQQQDALRQAQEPLAAVPAPADWSESEAWSEPDRDVSLARIGLDQSSLGTRTESWLAPLSDSEGRRSRRRQRAGAGSQHALELEAHIESLHQVKDALRAEVDIYRQVLPSGGRRRNDGQPRAEEAGGVLVPRQVLAEIHSLQQQLERAIVANERIRRQLEGELSPPDEAGLAAKLQEAERRLADTAHQLSDSQARCADLRAKLARAKDSLRLAQLNAQQFKDKFVRVSDDMVRLRERFSQLEADRERSSEEGRRRRSGSPSAVRGLQTQLEAAQTALRHQEQLADQLRRQLQAAPAAEAGSDSQLLAVRRQQLRLLGERAQLASRGRLLRSQSCLLRSEAERAAAGSRLEAAKWAGWALERRQLLAERDRLAEQHACCQHRLTELGSAMQADRRRLREVSAQLEEVNAEMDAMRLKLNDLDEGGQPESAGDCAPPAHRQPGAEQPEQELELQLEPAIVRSTSESDGHDAHHESDRVSAYSSPDLGIESDCGGPGLQLAETAGDGAVAGSPPDGSEADRLRRERDLMHSKLTATRAALRQALAKLSRADQRKARVERAIYRQLSKTHDILRRAKNNLAPPAAGAPQ